MLSAGDDIGFPVLASNNMEQAHRPLKARNVGHLPKCGVGYSPTAVFRDVLEPAKVPHDALDVAGLQAESPAALKATHLHSVIHVAGQYSYRGSSGPTNLPDMEILK